MGFRLIRKRTAGLLSILTGLFAMHIFLIAFLSDWERISRNGVYLRKGDPGFGETVAEVKTEMAVVGSICGCACIVFAFAAFRAKSPRGGVGD
jgi:hypothetical protein